MMNDAYFSARWLWNRGLRQEALDVIEELLRSAPNAPDEPVLLDRASIVENPGLSRFDIAITWLLITPDRLAWPVGAVFARMWETSPVQTLVTALTVRRFAIEDSAAEAVHLIVEALVASAAEGTLSGNPWEQPLGGRPVLALSTIREIDHEWDGMRLPLLDRLPSAYAGSPVDPWPGWAADRPAWVIGRGLDTLLGQHGAGAEVQTFWRTVRYRHPSFASALLVALEPGGIDLDSASLACLLEVYADVDHVADPEAWLAALRIALVSDDFTGLGLHSAERRVPDARNAAPAPDAGPTPVIGR